MTTTWFKITTAIWDDEKIKLIEARPDRDVMLVIWFKLLTQAGKAMAGGKVQLAEYIPLTDEDLSVIFNRPLEVVKAALTLFQRFRMIEKNEDGFIELPNWSKYQNVDALDRYRENGKKRVQEYRERKKNGNVTVTQHVTEQVTLHVTDKDKDKVKDKVKDKKNNSPAEPDKSPIPYSEVVAYLNEVCGTGYKATSPKTQALIRARWNEGHNRVGAFQTVIDNMYAEWANDPEMNIYLRPETLFGNKFESYFNRKPRRIGGGGNGGGKQRSEGGEDFAKFVIE